MIISNSTSDLATKIKQGKVVCFKTDTIWGFSADGTNLKAMQHLCKIKHRSINKPMIFLIKKSQDLTKIVKTIPQNAQKLINKFWCGSLTIIFEARDDITLPYKDNRTISLRMPNDPLTQEILSKLDAPIVSTSVNIEGKPSLNSFEDIVSEFSKEDFYILSPNALGQEKLFDSNYETSNIKNFEEQPKNPNNFQEKHITKNIQSAETNKNAPSTIVSCVNNKIEILREGSITKKQIEDCLK